MKFRYGSVKDCNIQSIDIDQVDIGNFLDKFEMIITGYDSDKDILAARELEILDGSRNEDNPDGVSMIFTKDGVYREYCWVRCEKLGEREIIGTLLNEPYEDFGVHIYDKVKFAVAETEDGFVCVALL